MKRRSTNCLFGAVRTSVEVGSDASSGSWVMNSPSVSSAFLSKRVELHQRKLTQRIYRRSDIDMTVRMQMP